MKRNILITGLLSLEMNRLENGNIGNWYIAEAVLSQISKFNAEIFTSWQISSGTLNRLDLANRVTIIPLNELHAFVDSMHSESDLFIDLQGDLFGDNSLLLVENSLQSAMALTNHAMSKGIRTALLASSVGPFDQVGINIETFREFYQRYDYVSLREPVSYNLLSSLDFDLTKTVVRPCPSVLFDEAPTKEFHAIFSSISGSARPLIGVALSGWNVSSISWNANDFSDEELAPFLSMLEIIVGRGFDVALISHSNGFKYEENEEVRRTPGRDRHLCNAIHAKVEISSLKNNIFIVPDLAPRDMFHLIGNLAGMIAGRVHAGLAAVAQNVPVLFVNYRNGPNAHKVAGFSQMFSRFPPLEPNASFNSNNELSHWITCLEEYPHMCNVEEVAIVKGLANDQFHEAWHLIESEA